MIAPELPDYPWEHPTEADFDRAFASPVIAEIAAERRRQMSVEGWTTKHDDEHTDGSLAGAAAAYALLSTVTDRADLAVLEDHGAGGMTHAMKAAWPESWDLKWFKPKGRRRDLVRAAALLVAEIERIDRAAAKQAA